MLSTVGRALAVRWFTFFRRGNRSVRRGGSVCLFFASAAVQSEGRAVLLFELSFFDASRLRRRTPPCTYVQ